MPIGVFPTVLRKLVKKSSCENKVFRIKQSLTAVKVAPPGLVSGPQRQLQGGYIEPLRRENDPQTTKSFCDLNLERVWDEGKSERGEISEETRGCTATKSGGRDEKGEGIRKD
jgi:hypothetical protein